METIVPESRIDEITSHEKPRAILLGGQPGSGKGSLAGIAEAELNLDAVKIDPDALRDYHPRVNEFRRTHPYTWSGLTHADAGQWADELRNAAVAGRKNIIFDTTLSNGEWSERFSRGLNADGHGRYVPASVRDHVYDKLPSSLDTIHARTDVPIRLFDREGTQLYDSRIDARSPGAALEEARDARL
ncbi:zeta toxin family protein, partial [Luteimonas huabeiensis]|uniref:zeta toxin family protein n=1 Tax=Luteimonas huabeiensis TaxID=1244513 RepID=UPI001F293E7A